MKQLIFYTIFLISLQISLPADSQSWLWAKQPVFVGNPPTQSDGEGYTVATDNAGNVFEAGFFAYASLHYGSTVLSSTNSDGFLVKYSPDGTVQWARQGTLVNNGSACLIYSLATDNAGNVYATGFFEDTVVFGSTILAASHGAEAFLVKYDANGNAIWARQSFKSVFSGYPNFGLCVSTDQSGNIYITGSYVGTTSFGAYSLTNPTGQLDQYQLEGNIFLVKYSSSGNVLWAQQASLPSAECSASARAVSTDASGNVFITGAFVDSISFGTQLLSTQSGAGEIFVAKYDGNGNALWARQSENQSQIYWGNGAVFGNAIATDKTGSVYITGNFEDDIFFGSTELVSPISFANYANPYGDMFMAKYEPNGDLAWAKAAYPGVNAAFAGWGVATDTFNHVFCYAGGWNTNVPGDFDFNVQFGGQTFTSGGQPSSECSLIMELDTSGNVLCGSILPVGGDENSGVAVDPTGRYVYTGSDFIAHNTVVVGPDSLILNSNPANAGVEIPFILRWQPCVVTSIPFTVSVTGTSVSCHSLCDGTATANPSGGTPPYSFLWNTSPTDTSQTITSLCPGQYKITLTDKNDSVASSMVTITQPVASIATITADKDSACAGDTVHLFVSNNLVNIQWQSSTGGNFNIINGADSAVYSNSLQQTTTYKVVSGICADTSSPFTVTVFMLPASSQLITPDSIFCSGDSTQICAPGLFTSYNWSTGDTSACTIAKQAGGYWLTVTDANGCSVVSNHQSISVYPVPSVSIALHGDTLFSFNSNAYQWLYNGTPINGATQAFYVATATGNYTVQITDSNGCQALSGSQYILITGSEDLYKNSEVHIFPNPTANTVFVLADNLYGVEVYDLTGRLLFTKSNVATSNRMEIDLSGLMSACYYFKIKANDTIFYRSVIKQ